MVKGTSRVLHTTEIGTRKIETVLVRVLRGADQIITKVNGEAQYIEGLTSVAKYTTSIAARQHHTRWVKALETATPERHGVDATQGRAA